MAQHGVKIVDRFFFSYTEEELWLNEMVKKGWLLKEKSFYRYTFVPTDDNLIITVQILDTPLKRDENRTFLELCNSKGEQLIDTYKCRAYFVRKVNDGETVTEKSVEHRFRLKYKHTLQYLIFTAIVYVISTVLLCYQCAKWLFFEAEGYVHSMDDIAAKGKIYSRIADLAKLLHLDSDSAFGDNATTVMILMMFIIVLISSAFFAAYLNDMLLLQGCKRNMKKQINAGKKN